MAGWCERFFLERDQDGSFGLYTKNGAAKYYLKVCSAGEAASAKSCSTDAACSLDRCAKFYFRKHSTKRVVGVCKGAATCRPLGWMATQTKTHTKPQKLAIASCLPG